MYLIAINQCKPDRGPLPCLFGLVKECNYCVMKYLVEMIWLKSLLIFEVDMILKMMRIVPSHFVTSICLESERFDVLVRTEIRPRIETNHSMVF